MKKKRYRRRRIRRRTRVRLRNPWNELRDRLPDLVFPSLSIRTKAIVIAVLAMILLVSIVRMNTVRGSYDGLGEEQTLAANPYKTEGFYWNNGLRYYRDAHYTSKVGIDVSAYQKEIDWQKVAGTGVKFAMIRVGYRGSTAGSIVEDARFQENIRGARAAGLDVGVYFYSMAKNTDEAVEEAKYTIRKIRKQGVTYPVAFDMEEYATGRVKNLTNQQRTEIADAFCSVVKQNGYIPMVYGNPTWLRNYVDLDYLSGYDIWLAHYIKTDITNFPYEYKMWQYSAAGKLAGITGKVDMNIMMIRR